MANSKQAIKRIRQSKKQTLRNKSRMSRLRTSIRNLRQYITKNEKSSAQNIFLTQTMSLIHKSVKHHLIHKRKASRLLSRLSSHIKSL